MIELATGDLFEAGAEALVNAVNTEGVMGKGIALQFKIKFPAMYAAYNRACKNGEVFPGKMHVFELPGQSAPKFIINFPTKRRWRSPSKLEDIETGLEALASEIRQREIKSIAVPALGCGNGGLDWKDIRPKIERALGNIGGARVLLYRPSQGDAPHTLSNGSTAKAQTGIIIP